MEWFTVAMAAQRRDFWRDVVSHDANHRLLSCEVTRGECASIARPFRHFDRVVPPILIPTTEGCSVDCRDLGDWLRRRAIQHKEWAYLWTDLPLPNFAVSIADGSEAGPMERLLQTFARFLRTQRVWSIFGLMTGIVWFDVWIAGSLRDVLGEIYGLPAAEIASLTARWETAIAAGDEIEQLLTRATDPLAQRSYLIGLRCAAPLLGALLAAAQKSWGQLEPGALQAHPVIAGDFSVPRVPALLPSAPTEEI